MIDDHDQMRAERAERSGGDSMALRGAGYRVRLTPVRGQEAEWFLTLLMTSPVTGGGFGSRSFRRGGWR